MDFLCFRLYAPLASFGEPAVGEDRPTHRYPARSAVLGLLAAALGIPRSDEAAQLHLGDSLRIAVLVCQVGALIRDYHTAQVPPANKLKKRPHRTRRDELSVARDDLGTILSRRDYRADCDFVVALSSAENADARFSLDRLQQALVSPRYHLYLGRKACVLAMPMQPQQHAGETLIDVLPQMDFAPLAGRQDVAPIELIASDPDFPLGYSPSHSVQRKDQPLSRQRWQFADRQEVIVLQPQVTGA